jgi:hypothetical protein
VGELVLNQAQFTAVRFLNGLELPGEGRAFLSLQMQMAGEDRLIMTLGHVRLLAGHIYLRDWANAFNSEATAMRLNAIMIPRHRLRAGVGMQEHTPVPSWSIAAPERRLLAMRWRELLAELGQVTLPQARTFCDTFLGPPERMAHRDDSGEPGRYAAIPDDASAGRRPRRAALQTLSRLAPRHAPPVRAPRRGQTIRQRRTSGASLWRVARG